MTARHDDVAALLGAWALDACSDEEAEDVVDHIAGCAECAAEAVRLRRAADLVAGVPLPAPGLKQRTLRRARARRAPAPKAPLYAEPYAAQVSVLDALLAELAPRDWTKKVLDAAARPLYGPAGRPAGAAAGVAASAAAGAAADGADGDDRAWSVQDLLAHLSATDGLLAGQLGPAGGPPADPAGILEKTAEAIERERARPPEETRAAWREQAAALCAALGGADHPVTVGQPMRAGAAVVSRAFETWIHADDIANAIGRHLPPPLPRHLGPIAELGVRSLPRALELQGVVRPADAARVVLDGPGGGTWLIPLGRDAPPEATVSIEMAAVEFCFLAGGRRDPDAVPARVTGDGGLGRALLAAAPAFSGP